MLFLAPDATDRASAPCCRPMRRRKARSLSNVSGTIMRRAASTSGTLGRFDQALEREFAGVVQAFVIYRKVR